MKSYLPMQSKLFYLMFFIMIDSYLPMQSKLFYLMFFIMIDEILSFSAGQAILPHVFYNDR